MFLVKKIVSQFFFPMPLCLAMCFAGLALLWWSRRQKAGKILLTTGLFTLTAVSYSPVADALLRPLEQSHPVYCKGAGEPVKFVVVLGGGHNSDPDLPLSSQLSDESLRRLVEGIRVLRENPGSKLLLSGGRWRDPIPDANVMADTAKLLGVSASDLILEAESRDTEEEVHLIKPMVTTNRFVLVTSANHMPRSISLFRRQGMDPEPAPTGHLVPRRSVQPATFFPGGQCLTRTERAVYEYLGLGWMRITSCFSRPLSS